MHSTVKSTRTVDRGIKLPQKYPLTVHKYMIQQFYKLHVVFALFCSQSVRQVILVTTAVRPVHNVSIAMDHVTTSQDSVNVCQASREHCVMRVSDRPHTVASKKQILVT